MVLLVILFFHNSFFISVNNDPILVALLKFLVKVLLHGVISYQIFINTELYARVSVAVLFYKLADLADRVGSINKNDDCHAATESGKLFLLELLDFVVIVNVIQVFELFLTDKKDVLKFIYF